MSKNKKKMVLSQEADTIVCGVCNDMVNSDCEDVSIECQGCLKWIHAGCSGLRQPEISKIVADSTICYNCPTCKPKRKKTAASSLSLSPNITPNFSQSQFDKIMSRFDELSEIKKDTDEIKKTIEFLTENQNDNNVKCEKISKNFVKLEKENEDLKRALALQNVRLNALENAKLKFQCFLRKPTIAINKSAVSDDVIQVARALGVNCTKSDINSAVIQQQMSNDKMTIIKIEFNNIEKKLLMMRSKSKLKELPNYKQFSMFDVLSRSGADLFKHAKLLKAEGFSHVYHHSGKIFVKKTHQSEAIYIQNKQKVDALLHEVSDARGRSGSVGPRN